MCEIRKKKLLRRKRPHRTTEVVRIEVSTRSKPGVVRVVVLAEPQKWVGVGVVVGEVVGERKRNGVH